MLRNSITIFILKIQNHFICFVLANTQVTNSNHFKASEQKFFTIGLNRWQMLPAIYNSILWFKSRHFFIVIPYYFIQRTRKFKSDELNDEIMERKFFNFFSYSVYLRPSKNCQHFFFSSLSLSSYVIQMEYAWKNAFEL